MPVVAVGRLLGYRIAIHHHSFGYIDRRSKAMSFIVRMTNGVDTTRHILLCGKMADGFISRYRVHTSRTCVVSNSDILDLRPQLRVDRYVDGQPIVLGHLSNLSIDKGLDSVIDAFEQCLGSHLDVRLTIAGPCSEPAANQLLQAARRRHPDRLEYVGPLTSDQVMEFLAQVDVFLFPSRYRHEAQPLVILEAQAAGARVVATNVGCVSSMLRSADVATTSGRFSAEVEHLVRALLRDGAGKGPAGELDRPRRKADLLEVLGAV
jgi:glycosyltransferase involved in cell wall biosynthesis